MRQLAEAQMQWLFDKTALEHTPSKEDDVSLEDESTRRKTVLEYIKSLALRSGLGTEDSTKDNLRRVMIVAATLTHRFYMRRSLEDFKEKLIAPTILFLASKIEEEPIKLRHIVNNCLDKWDPAADKWIVDPNNKENYPQQSREYQAWEREILSAEEMALDALCFDMTLESPWIILQRATDNLKSLDGTLNEDQINEVCGKLVDTIIYPPLLVIHHPDTIAFGVLVMAVGACLSIPLFEAVTAMAELSEKFGIDVKYKEKGADGKDLPAVNAFLENYQGYVKNGLVDGSLIQSIPIEPTGAEKKKSFPRRFTEPPRPAKANGQGPAKKKAKKNNGHAAMPTTEEGIAGEGEK